MYNKYMKARYKILMLLVLCLSSFILFYTLKNDLFTFSNTSSGEDNKNPETSDYITNKDKNWKVYSSEKYGFEFRYPQDLKIIATEDAIFLRRELITDVNNYDSNFSMNLNIYEKVDNIKLFDFVKEEICNKKDIELTPPPWGEKFYTSCIKLCEETKKEYLNGTIKGISCMYNPNEMEANVVAFEKDKNIYTISISTGETGSSVSTEGLKTLDQIVSTFSFKD
jgi:hypothetical protein